ACWTRKWGDARHSSENLKGVRALFALGKRGQSPFLEGQDPGAARTMRTKGLTMPCRARSSVCVSLTNASACLPVRQGEKGRRPLSLPEGTPEKGSDPFFRPLFHGKGL